MPRTGLDPHEIRACFDFCLSGGKVGLAFAEEPGVGGGAAPVVNQHGHVNQDDDSHRQRPHPDVTVLTAEEALPTDKRSTRIILCTLIFAAAHPPPADAPSEGRLPIP